MRVDRHRKLTKTESLRDGAPPTTQRGLPIKCSQRKHEQCTKSMTMFEYRESNEYSLYLLEHSVHVFLLSSVSFQVLAYILYDITI